MSKPKQYIELDRSKINPNDIDNDGKPDGKPLDELHDGIGYEKEFEINKESRKELKFKKKRKWISISLRIADGLRLAERFVNKYLGFLIGNNENPFPKVVGVRLNVIYIVLIVILIILLIIK